MLMLNKRYVVVSQLGKGGFGVVCKAEDTMLGNRFVAIKAISQRRLNVNEVTHATEAFRREAHMLAALSHQNLPRIYEHFNENSNSYLVMDFIEGETLADLLRQANGKGLLPEEVLLIAEQLCSVLGYLHARRPPIIFRDLKPANVMITSSGDHLYLIDFGIARFFKPGQLKDTFAFGTAGYAAPEQYHSSTTARSDIYSLGVMLHQLLTALDPSKTPTPFSFPPIRAYNPQTPPPLEEIIMQMVQIDPLHRPASMQVIKQELQCIRQGLLHVTAPQATINVKDVLTPPQSRSIAKGTPPCVYNKHAACTHTLAWSPNGQCVASASRDKTIQVWDALSGDKKITYKGHLSYVYSVAWSVQGDQVASSSFGAVHIWDASSGATRVVYRDHSLWVYAVAWSPSGTLIASGGADGEMHLWDARNGNCLCKYQGYSRPIRALAWSAGRNSPRIVVGCEDAILYCWQIATTDPPLLYEGHKREISSVVWSPDNTQIASGSRDKTVKIWEACTGKLLYTYQEHTREVCAVAWSPNGKYIASAGEDKTVRIWEAFTGKTVYTYLGHTKEVYTIAWSLDSSYVASAGEDKAIHVWQVV